MRVKESCKYFYELAEDLLDFIGFSEINLIILQ